VSRKAGVGKGTIYRYFKDKEDLYYRTILDGFDELIISLQQCALHGCGKSGGVLVKLAEEVERFFTERRGLFALLRSEEMRGSDRRCRLRRQWREKRRAIVEIFADVIRLGIQERRYRAAADPKILASLFLGMLRASFRHSRRFDGGRHSARIVVRIFEDGIRRE